MGKTKKNYINTEHEVSIHRLCKYIGSFAINMMKSEERQILMNDRLEELRNAKKGIPVVIQVSTNGIKVFDEKETKVKMAHAIMRVAFSSCSPDYRLFSYVAKSSTSSQSPSILQAHVFKTKKGSHAQQLSAIVSKAFKLAFAMATVKRKQKLDEFESRAKTGKQTTIEKKRRWAKKEIARGHKYSEHAERARRSDPLAMLPGPSDPIHREAIRDGRTNQKPHCVSNIYLDSQKSTQASQSVDAAKEVVDAQVHNALASQPNGMMSQNPSKEAEEVSIPDELQRGLAAKGGNAVGNVSNREMIDDISTCQPEIVRQMMPAPSQDVANYSVFASKTQQSDGLRLSAGVYEKEATEQGSPYESASEESSSSEDIYVNMTQPSENLHEPLSQPPVDYPINANEVGDKRGGDDDIVAEARVVKEGVKGDKMVAEKHAYISVNDFKQEKFCLTPTDRTVLEDSYWYQPELPRDIAEEMLSISKPGTFFIRESASNPGSFALSLKIPQSIKESGIGNILIEKDQNGDFNIPGLKNTFQSITMLVAYYASFQDELPVKLRLTFEEDTSMSGNNFNTDGKVSDELVAEAPSHSPSKAPSEATTPEEEAIAMIDAVLPYDPDFTIYESCEPILNELNGQLSK